MITKFINKTISSVVTVLPETEVNFMDEMDSYGYSPLKMKMLKKMMGYNTRRVCKKGEGVSDYAIYGIQHLIDQNVLSTDEVGAIIVTSTSPDFFIPPTSNLIQGHFNISHECVCIDVSQGCCGYSVGLTYSFMTLEHLPADKKVLLVCGDMMSQKIGERDRTSRPIIGDAVTVSVIAAVAVAAVGITIFLINRNMILATTMRLLKVEGTVNIEDASGTVKPVIDNIRFQSGDTLSTGADGLASIGLDDTKIVTLENDSRAEFYKNNKQLELQLTKGALFFEVTEKLAEKVAVIA